MDGVFQQRNGQPQGKPTVNPPQRKSEAPTQPGEGGGRLISEAQRKRFYAICKAQDPPISDEKIKSKVYIVTGQESSKGIPIELYDELVAWAENTGNGAPDAA